MTHLQLTRLHMPFFKGGNGSNASNLGTFYNWNHQYIALLLPLELWCLAGVTGHANFMKSV